MSKRRYSPFEKFAIGISVVYVIMQILIPLAVVVGLFVFFGRSCHSEDFSTEEEIVEKMQKIFPNV